MISDRPLFVFGAARSGTSFFARLLRDHFDYGFGPEAKFLVDLGRQAGRFGDLSKEAALDALIERLLNTEMVQIVNTRYSQHFGKDMRVQREQVRRHLKGRSYPQVVLALFAAIAQRMGKTRVGNKFPDYWKHLPQLLAWYPEARFIHLLRDGRDVALSTRRMEWGAHTVYASACEWKRMLNQVSAFERRVNPAQLLCLRYEELLHSPQLAFARLCRFLDIAPDRGRQEQFVREILDAPDRAQYQRWARQMSPREQRLFEGVAGQQLLDAGYPVAVQRSRISWAEHVYYQMEDTGRRSWQKAHNLLVSA